MGNEKSTHQSHKGLVSYLSCGVGEESKYMVTGPGVLGREAAPVLSGLLNACHVTFEDVFVFFSLEEYSLLDEAQRLLDHNAVLSVFCIYSHPG